MRSELFPLILNNWITNANYFLSLVVILVFFSLPIAFQRRPENLLIFLYTLIFTTIDPIGLGLRIFQSINGPVNEFFGNPENPLYNLWIYNIILKMIMPLVAIQLIRVYLPPRQKAIVKKVLIGFVLFTVLFQVLQIEPIYIYQGVLASVGSLCILATCFLYFFSLMDREEYIFKNILRLPSFWQVTFIMFYTALTYFNDVSINYLSKNQREFLTSMLDVNEITGLVQSIVFILCLAAPLLKLKVETQPVYD